MVLAKRKAADWFVVVVSGEASPKTVLVNTAFLPKGTYSLTVFKDGASSEEIVTTTQKFQSGKSLSLPLPPNGGSALWFKKLSYK